MTLNLEKNVEIKWELRELVVKLRGKNSYNFAKFRYTIMRITRKNSLNYEEKFVKFREKCLDKMLRINSLNHEKKVVTFREKKSR